MTIPRDEKLRIVQRVHAAWSKIYDDRDDAEPTMLTSSYMKKRWLLLKRNIKIAQRIPKTYFSPVAIALTKASKNGTSSLSGYPSTKCILRFI